MLGPELTWKQKFELLYSGGKICLPFWHKESYWFLKDGAVTCSTNKEEVTDAILFRMDLRWYEWLPNEVEILLTPDHVGERVRLANDCIVIIEKYDPHETDGYQWYANSEWYNQFGRTQYDNDEHIVEILE